MKIVCSKTDLVRAVGIVSKAVPSRTTMPILECILIDAQTSVIRLTANDMELGIETVLPGTIVEKGLAALDAKLFSDMIRKLPESDITLETDANYLATITCGKAVFRIPGRDGEDFSRIPMIEKNVPLVISQFTLKDLIRQTIFSIAQNDTNKIMTGELFEIRGDHLRVVSLDGHRISIRNVTLKDSYDDQKVIVPGKTLIEISRILSGETEDMVDIYMTKNHIMFSFDETIVVSRLIEGSYFMVDQMLSSDYETKVNINQTGIFDGGKEIVHCQVIPVGIIGI